MLEKKDIETILKINGVAPTAPNEEIRSILLSAKYNNDEIDTAIMILRENKKTHETKVDGLHKIFRSDDSLKPSEISSLLGIEVDIDFVERRRIRNPEMTMLQKTLVSVIAIAIALAGVFSSMYVYKVGLFHPAMNSFRAGK